MASHVGVIIQAVFCLVAVLLLLLVARVQRVRMTSSDGSVSALQSFVVWWLTLAVFYGVQTIFHLSRLGVDWGVQGLASVAVLVIAIYVLAFGFLMDYLMFIVHGDFRFRRPIVVFYGVLFLAMAVATPLSGPYTVEETSAGPALAGGNGATVGDIITFALFIPVVAALVLQMRFWFASDDRTTRYRIGMVVLSILVIMTALTTSTSMPEAIELGEESDPYFILEGGGVLVSGFLPVLGAWAGYRAYRPAAWVEKRFGIRELGGRPTHPDAPLHHKN